MPTLTHAVRSAHATIETSILLTRSSHQLVATSQRLIAANVERLRARRVAIGLEGRGVMYAVGRRPLMWGGSESGADPEDIIAQRRRDILDLKLKRHQVPVMGPWRASYSDGSALSCFGCDEVITKTEVQVQIVFAGTLSMRLHSLCFAAWRDAAERATADL